MKKIVVDVLGGDDNSEAMILGVKKALEIYGGEYDFVLAGPKEKILAVFQNEEAEILDTDIEVSNTTNPMDMLHDAENAALSLCYKYIRDHQDTAGLLTVSSTACVLVGAIFKLGMIKGIKAPVLATDLFRPDFSRFLLIDCGANVDSNVNQMLDFAKIGNAYEKAMGIKSPRIALANVGYESTKGNKLMKETYKRLSESGLNFTGNVEFNRVFFDDFDVLVSEGTVGNCILKVAEGAGRILMERAPMNEEAHSFTNHMFNYTDQGAAMLLGPKTIILKAHGGASSDTVVNSIEQLIRMDKGDFISLMVKEFSL